MEIETTREYRQKVLEALEEARKRFSGSNGEFAKKYGLHPSIYSEIVKGKITADTERKIGDADGWLSAVCLGWPLRNVPGGWPARMCST